MCVIFVECLYICVLTSILVAVPPFFCLPTGLAAQRWPDGAAVVGGTEQRPVASRQPWKFS